MGVRQQRHATKRADRGKNQSCKLRLQAIGFHFPLKNRKHDHENDGDSMLKNIRGHKTFPEAVRAERPVLGIGTKEQKQSEAEKNQWPHPRPTEIFASRK